MPLLCTLVTWIALQEMRGGFSVKENINIVLIRKLFFLVNRINLSRLRQA